MQTLLDHVDFQRKFTHFMSELWIDPEVCLILSVGEPSDFLADEALVDEFLCNLHVSVDEFISDFRKFIAFCKRHKFYNRLIGRVYTFCSEEDHPFIDVIHHELLDLVTIT